MREVEVEAPDFVSGIDLCERLARFGAQLVHGDGSVMKVLVPNAPAAPVLDIVDGWVERWHLTHVELRVSGRRYRLRGVGKTRLPRREARAADTPRD